MRTIAILAALAVTLTAGLYAISITNNIVVMMVVSAVTEVSGMAIIVEA